MNASAPVRTRWVGIGHATAADAARAGTDAVTAALAGRTDAELVLLVCDDAADAGRAAAAAAAAVPGALVAGWSTGGEIAVAAGPGEAPPAAEARGAGAAQPAGARFTPAERRGSAVATAPTCAAVALGGSDFAVSSAAVPAGDDLRAAAAEAAACIGDVDGSPHRALLLLVDGRAGDPQDAVRGAYSVAGAGVPLVGACVGDGLRLPAGRLLHGGAEPLESGVVAVALGSRAPLGIGVRHGWLTTGEPILVSATAPGAILRLDGAPALDVYLERTGAPEGIEHDDDAFGAFAASRPLGLARRGHEAHVRVIAAADLERRALRTVAAAPQGALAWVMEAGEDAVRQAVNAAAAGALAPLGTTSPLALLAFDCVARGTVLGPGAHADAAARLGRIAPALAVSATGEIARTRGVSGFHDQAVAVLAVA